MDLQPHDAMLSRENRRKLNAIHGSAILPCPRRLLRTTAVVSEGVTRPSSIGVRHRVLGVNRIAAAELMSYAEWPAIWKTNAGRSASPAAVPGNVSRYPPGSSLSDRVRPVVAYRQRAVGRYNEEVFILAARLADLLLFLLRKPWRAQRPILFSHRT